MVLSPIMIVKYGVLVVHSAACHLRRDAAIYFAASAATLLRTLAA